MSYTGSLVVVGQTLYSSGVLYKKPTEHNHYYTFYSTTLCITSLSQNFSLKIQCAVPENVHTFSMEGE